jgi:hypothetical protein
MRLRAGAGAPAGLVTAAGDAGGGRIETANSREHYVEASQMVRRVSAQPSAADGTD